MLWQADHRLLRARHARLSGDPEATLAHAEAALTRAEEPRQPLALLAAHRLLGELNTDAGHHAEARAHLDAALTLADACAAPYERALTLCALVGLHAAAGEMADARARLDAARAICLPLGAVLTLARIAAMDDAITGSAPSGFRAPGGLSRREVQVLRLLAAGRSNGQIAAALFLSPRTVQRHVANLYLKVGAHDRAGATAYARRHQLA